MLLAREGKCRNLFKKETPVKNIQGSCITNISFFCQASYKAPLLKMWTKCPPFEKHISSLIYSWIEKFWAIMIYCVFAVIQVFRCCPFWLRLPPLRQSGEVRFGIKWRTLPIWIRSYSAEYKADLIPASTNWILEMPNRLYVLMLILHSWILKWQQSFIQYELETSFLSKLILWLSIL